MADKKKIYFCGSIRGGYQDAELYQEIIRYLKRTSTVLTEHIGLPDLGRKEIRMTDEEIFTQDMDWLRESDIVIAEATTPSLGVGYELANAKMLSKPTFVIYNTDRAKLSAMINGDRYFQCFGYQKRDEIFPLLDKFIRE